MRITRTVTAAGLAASLSLIATSALAVPIELFNTGVDSSGTVLADGANDPNYAILSPAQQAVVINESEIPGTWLDNDSTSRWIWQTNTGDPTNVTLTFRTTFDLTGLDPDTAEINGRWAVDNGGDDILLNGASTGITNNNGFTSFTDFTLTAGFQAGLNTLDFVVRDAGFIAGFRAELSGTADEIGAVVPLPAGLPMLVAALAGLSLLRRKA
ncbi:MAG: VPLPA-CTERM sorting domain-containing protein [Pseudomonadota bacterium]